MRIEPGTPEYSCAEYCLDFMVLTSPWARPKRGSIDYCGIGNGKGEIKRAHDGPYRYCAFFDRCSEGGWDENGDEGHVFYWSLSTLRQKKCVMATRLNTGINVALSQSLSCAQAVGHKIGCYGADQNLRLVAG